MTSKGPFIGQGSSRFSCLNVINALSLGRMRRGNPAVRQVCVNQFRDSFRLATPLEAIRRHTRLPPAVADHLRVDVRGKKLDVRVGQARGERLAQDDGQGNRALHRSEQPADHSRMRPRGGALGLDLRQRLLR